MVNVTSYKDGCDSACIVEKGDHDFITHKSFFNYADTQFVELSILDKLLAIEKYKDFPKIKLQGTVSSTLLKKIQEGPKKSDAFPIEYRNLI
ncbi:MAG: hypothetical protein HQK89_08890 [Nitrospirae bacterium]|nr:hypothetical protein [Nitrospirota bacterium]